MLSGFTNYTGTSGTPWSYWIPCCNILVPWEDLNGFHTNTAKCTKGEYQKWHHMMAEKMRESTAQAFQAYGRPLDIALYFKYLGCIMMASDDDWPALVGNLRKARKSWLWLFLEGVRDVFQGGGGGGSAFWVINVGNDHPHGPVPGGGGGVNTRYPERSLGGSPGGYWKGFGSTHLLIQLCRRQGSKSLRYMC